jgi:hypothetical protein
MVFQVNVTAYLKKSQNSIRKHEHYTGKVFSSFAFINGANSAYQLRSCPGHRHMRFSKLTAWYPDRDGNGFQMHADI